MKTRFKQRIVSTFLLLLILCVAGVFAGAYYYRLDPVATIKGGMKYAAVYALQYVYAGDMDDAAELSRENWVGSQDIIEKKEGTLNFSPFVYEQISEPYLETLRQEFNLQRVISSSQSEYEAQLKLGAWLGTRWDHGTSPLEGTKEERNPVDIIRAGEAGEKYWCEIAAIVTVQTATAMGYPARLVMLSRNGYDMEHGVAEIWSNQFNKWYVMDTDFNVIFEKDGIPLSAFELCHDGLKWQEQGALQKNFFTPSKPSMPYKDLLPFYRYVRVDLRNDWLSRDLRPGSPAGGDLATWWTSREGSGPVLTASERVDDPERFDWKVNQVVVKALQTPAKVPSQRRYDLTFSAYAPYYSGLQMRIDGGPWEVLSDFSPSLVFDDVLSHHVDARVISVYDNYGPVTGIILER